MTFYEKFGVRDLGAPWYAGTVSFMRSPWVLPSEVVAGDVAVVGMPIDWFGWSRFGARWGPRGIREASLFLAGRYGIQTDRGFIDLKTGRVSVWPSRLPLVDTGDVPIFQADVNAQIESASQHVAEASKRSKLTVSLGGDHFVAYLAFEGIVRAWRERRPGVKIGYLHIDSHSDFWDDMTILGRFNHGTCVRRISEIQEVKKVAWFGLNQAAIEPNQFEVMKERGYRACTSYYSQRVGIRDSMEQVLEYVASDVDVVYASIDIDVVNGADAPATATPTFDGLSAADFLDAMQLLGELESLVGIDICEVHPPVETSKRTERLASVAIATVLGERILPTARVVSGEELGSVFWR